MTNEQARTEGLKEVVLLPPGWSVEFHAGWADRENGPSPTEDLGAWSLKKDGFLVVDADVGSPEDGLYEWLTGGDSDLPPDVRVTYPQEDVIQIIDHLRSVGAVI